MCEWGERGEMAPRLCELLRLTVGKVEARDVHASSQHLLNFGNVARHGTEGADDLRLALGVADAVAGERGEVDVAEILQDVFLLHLELGQIDVAPVLGAADGACHAHLCLSALLSFVFSD